MRARDWFFRSIYVLFICLFFLSYCNAYSCLVLFVLFVRSCWIVVHSFNHMHVCMHSACLFAAACLLAILFILFWGIYPLVLEVPIINTNFNKREKKGGQSPDAHSVLQTLGQRGQEEGENEAGGGNRKQMMHHTHLVCGEDDCILLSSVSLPIPLPRSFPFLLSVMLDLFCVLPTSKLVFIII